ncbi:hypothetical protein AWB80_00687 [Caballeronia pedi]|uniref:Uncharacterized protein n=1 Tax=Caballeronia pedi TaxID=1777141 RepID=A0A157ZED5_9BURK|nr:hypothetical protein AWB80_00687 [Caballeronia pedi]
MTTFATRRRLRRAASFWERVSVVLALIAGRKAA